MGGYLFALLLSVVVLGVIVYLLRKRRLREKYAAAWLVVGLIVVVVGLFPGLLFRLSDLVGVETPVNLLFALGGVLLLLVTVQYSVEISTLEEETRTLAEELALLRAEVEQLRPQAESDDAHRGGDAD